jgi:hypothetical protein
MRLGNYYKGKFTFAHIHIKRSLWGLKQLDNQPIEAELLLWCPIAPHGNVLIAKQKVLIPFSRFKSSFNRYDNTYKLSVVKQDLNTFVDGLAITRYLPFVYKTNLLDNLALYISTLSDAHKLAIMPLLQVYHNATEAHNKKYALFDILEYIFDKVMEG